MRFKIEQIVDVTEQLQSPLVRSKIIACYCYKIKEEKLNYRSDQKRLYVRHRTNEQHNYIRWSGVTIFLT